MYFPPWSLCYWHTYKTQALQQPAGISPVSSSVLFSTSTIYTPCVSSAPQLLHHPYYPSIDTTYILYHTLKRLSTHQRNIFLFRNYRPIFGIYSLYTKGYELFLLYHVKMNFHNREIAIRQLYKSYTIYSMKHTHNRGFVHFHSVPIQPLSLTI